MKRLNRKIYVLVMVVVFASVGVNVSCSRTQIQNTIQEHNIIVKPGSKIRPRSYERGDGNTERLDTGPETGDTLMLIIRGKI